MIKTIEEIVGGRLSGIAVVKFEDGSKVYVESGFGLRQLSDAATNSGLDSPVGMTIDFEKGPDGVMSGFSVVD